MLYDFHSWQIGKKAGTVHATYMIYGTKQKARANGHSQQGEDVEMASSPPESAPQAEEVSLVTLSLVAEENLSGTVHCHCLYTHNSGVSADLIMKMFSLSTSKSRPFTSTASARIRSR